MSTRPSRMGVPVVDVMIGPFNLILGLGISPKAPSLSGILLAGVVGFVGYGISIALFVVAPYATSEPPVPVRIFPQRLSLAPQ